MKVDNSTVIDLTENPKNAALYFDYVIPLSPIAYYDKSFRENVKNIIPKSMIVNPSAYYDFLNKQKEGEVLDLHRILNNFFKSGKNDNIEAWFTRYPILYSDDEQVYFQTDSYDTTSLKLTKISIIDTTKARWEQIVEIRKDNTSINKLRKLKTFFHENYSGKDKNFIQDDLLNRIEEYNNTVKDWGFDTLTSSISLLLTSPVTLATAGTSLAVGLFGEPLKALVAAGTGVGLEIGKISLHIAKEKHKLMKLGRDHPLAYIFNAKKKLAG